MKWDPNQETMKWDDKHKNIVNYIIKQEWDPTKTVQDPRNETIKWDPK